MLCLSIYDSTVPQIVFHCFIISPILILTTNPTPIDNYLTFSDPESLSGVVAREDDTFFGPIIVSEAMASTLLYNIVKYM